MRQARKSMAVGILGLGALVLLASPSFAAGDHSGAASGGPIQLAHMGQGPAGQWTGQPCPMGRMGAGMGGQGMKGPGMMRPGMMRPGMMGPGMMGPDMMGPGTMGPGIGGQGMMGPGFGRGAGIGDRVVPVMDLTADDVRHFLQHRLEIEGNARLTLGEVKEADDDKIVAEITTVDGSLVQRFEVDRHTGQMQQVE